MSMQYNPLINRHGAKFELAEILSDKFAASSYRDSRSLRFPCLRWQKPDQAEKPHYDPTSIREALQLLENFRKSIISEHDLAPPKKLSEDLEEGCNSDYTYDYPILSSSSSSSCMAKITPSIVSNFAEPLSQNILTEAYSDDETNEEGYVFSLLNTDRIDAFMLSFVSLPRTEITEDCFLPNPHLTHIDLLITPIFKNNCNAFFLLQFRSQFWVGIASEANSRLQRCRDVLYWVRMRKTVIVIPESKNKNSATTSLIRDCSAIMTALSGEVFGISPLRVACNLEKPINNLLCNSLFSEINNWLRILAMVSKPPQL